MPAHKPMSVRISATGLAEGGITGNDAWSSAAVRRGGVDLVDVSPDRRARRPAGYGRMFQTPFSEQVRTSAVATMCVGNITTSISQYILAAGRADLVALAGRIWSTLVHAESRGLVRAERYSAHAISAARSRFSATGVRDRRISTI